jgi:hypothetical protein
MYQHADICYDFIPIPMAGIGYQPPCVEHPIDYWVRFIDVYRRFIQIFFGTGSIQTEQIWSVTLWAQSTRSEIAHGGERPEIQRIQVAIQECTLYLDPISFPNQRLKFVHCK